MSNKLKAKDYTEEYVKAGSTDELIEMMEQDKAESDREMILDTMTPAFKDKLLYIKEWFRNHLRHSLESHHELGLQVKEMYDDGKKGGKIYGRHAIERICKVLHWNDSVIRNSLRFACLYSKEELQELSSIVLSNGSPLMWAHVRALLTIDDKDQRQEMLDRTIENGWTSSELNHELRWLNDPARKEGRGRPPKRPSNFDGAVSQQFQFIEQWDRMYAKVWSVPDLSLSGQARKLSPEEVTEERRNKASELAHQLRQLATQAQSQAERAEQVVQELDRILDEQSST